MSIRNTTKRKLLASAGTTVLVSVMASGAFAAEVTIPDLYSINPVLAHKPSVQVLTNTAGVDDEGNINASVSGAHGGVTVVGTQAGTSNTVTSNTISAGATANTFSNQIDLSLIQDEEIDDVNNLGLAALSVATNTGIVTSAVDASSLSIDLTGFTSGTAVNSDNTIRAQSTVNSGSTTIAGTIPNGYQSSTEGRSGTDFSPASTDIHTAEASIVASSVQLNSATGHAASVDDNAIGLSLKSDLVNDVNSSPTLDRNTIDAAMTVNSAASTINLQRQDDAEISAPAFQGSAAVTNLQSNLNGSASASNSGSSIGAAVTGTGGGALNELNGGLSVQDNTISSAAAGNQSTGKNGAAGNRILIGDQIAVQGAGTTGPDGPGSAVAYDAGGTAANSIADLIILNSQGNSGIAPQNRLTISSTTEDGTVGAMVDSLDGGSVTLAGNAVTSQGVGNSASSAVQSGEGASQFDATVALLNQQINYNADVSATTSDTAVTAVVGSATGGTTNESTVTVSGNRSAARAYGNDVGQTIALEANTLNGASGLAALTGGTTGATNDGNASASGAVTIASLQSIYNGDVDALNQNSVIGLDADTRIPAIRDVIGSSSLSTNANTQEAVALGSSGSNGISLTGNTVGGGAGIASVQIGDEDSAVSSTLTGAQVGLIAGTHAEDSTLSVTGNLQRAIAYGTMATNTLAVEANGVNVAAGGAGAAGTYNPAGDPFHSSLSQPTVEASFGVLNDQSVQGPVAAAADGVIGLSVEGDVSGSSTTNDGNALVAAAYGNDAANGISLDAGTLTSTGFASVAHVGNAQAAFGDAAVSATAFGGQVVTTDIEDNVLGSTVSTSTNQVQALASGSQVSNNLAVSGNTVDTSGIAAAGLSLAGGELSGTTSFGVTNAQAGAGSVSASLLNGDPDTATSSASVLTRIGGDATTIGGSAIASNNNSLSAQATSNSADNALGIQANGVATSSGVTNFQVTDADVSAHVGIPGTPGTAFVPADNFGISVTALDPEDLDGSVSGSNVTLTDGTLSFPTASLSPGQIAYLTDHGWSSNGTTISGSAALLGTISFTDYSALLGGGTVDLSYTIPAIPASDGVPNNGGVTIVAEGASIVDSTLSVGGNKVNGAVTGNSAANALSVDAATIAGGNGLTGSVSQADTSITTSADHSLLNQQSVGEGTLESSVAGSFGIATAEDAAITGSSFSVSGNSQRATSVANTASSTLSLTGNDISAGSALISAQGSEASVAAGSNVEIFAPAAVSASSVDISGNANTALGVINDATNTSTISATNIAALNPSLGVGEVGNAVLDVEDMSAAGDHVLQNLQVATTSVESTATTSLYNVDRAAPATSGLVDSSFAMDGNTTYAEASANRAANTMTLNGSASQGASGGVFNLQTNDATATASATTNAGLTLAGDTAVAALSNSTVSLDSNSTTALARGNTATNVLNSVAGANYGTSSGTAGIEFGTVSGSSVHATSAVLNAQDNSGAVTASSVDATYTVALNAAAVGNPAVANGSVSVSGNSVAAQAFGNNAVNQISLTGLNTGTSTAALGSIQTNSGAITASVVGANIGLVSSGTAGGSSFSVGSNTISANAVGNSVSNAISRK